MNRRKSKQDRFRPFQDKVTAWISAIVALIALIITIGEKCNSNPDFPVNIIADQKNNVSQSSSNSTTIPHDSFHTKALQFENQTSVTPEKKNFSVSNQIDYQVRLFTNNDLFSESSILLDGKEAIILEQTQNITKIVVPELDKSYAIAIILNQDTIQCQSIYIKKNNERKSIICNFQ